MWQLLLNRLMNRGFIAFQAPRWKLLRHRKHTSPGWVGDANPRRKIVFRNHSKISYSHGHKHAVIYWRLRAVKPVEQKQASKA